MNGKDDPSAVVYQDGDREGFRPRTFTERSPCFLVFTGRHLFGCLLFLLETTKVLVTKMV